jgi:RNAse (barnase) inhibitor barstar
MKNFKFTKEKINPDINSVFAMVDSSIVDKQELFSTLSKQLFFPKYSGTNWDALYDLLSDFHWIKVERIYIIHLDLPSLSLKDLKSYVDVLYDAMNNWKEGEAHLLEIVFQEKDRNNVEKIRQLII